MRWPELNRKHRKARQDRSAFASLIADPAIGAFTLPANAIVFLRSEAGCIAGAAAATIGSRNIKAPELIAGGKASAGFIERGVAITAEGGFSVLIDTGLGRFAKIGEGA